MKHELKITSWNTHLRQQIDDFRRAHGDVTVFFIDMCQIFNDLFDYPEKHGFATADIHRTRGGNFWMDGLHPTSAVHKVIADAVHAEIRKLELEDTTSPDNLAKN